MHSLFAYIDPGGGSALLQLLVAAAAGGAAALRAWWQFLRRPRSQASASGSWLREIQSIRAWHRLPASERGLVIYSEHESYWAYFEGLLAELASRGIRVSYITSDPHDPVLASPNPAIQAFYVNRLLPWFLSSIACGAVIMTATDLGSPRLPRSRRPVHYAYVFHALMSTHMIYPEAAFDQYDSLLCCGPYQIREIRRRERVAGLPPKILVDAGYSRLERIYAAAARAGVLGGTVPGRTVLIAPSWADENVFESSGIELTAALRAAGYHVILRPHPELLKRRPRVFQALKDRFAGDRMIEFETSVRTDAALIRADTLVTDWSGVALEYALGTERPVISISTPRKVRNPRYTDSDIAPVEVGVRARLGTVLQPGDVGGVVAAIEVLHADREQWAVRLAALRTELVPMFGQFGAIAVDHLLSIGTEQPVIGAGRQVEPDRV